jgi:hypothetical protein
MGAPLKLLDELLAQRIVNAVRAGLPWKLAAQAAGVGWSTLKEWKARGREGEEPYAAFLARLESADGEAAQAAMGAILAAAAEPKHWTAAAWMLERRHPELFALKREYAKDEAAPATAEADDLAIAKSVVAALESRKAG